MGTVWAALLLAFQQPLGPLYPVGHQPRYSETPTDHHRAPERPTGWITGTIEIESGGELPYPPVIANHCGAALKSTWKTFQVAEDGCLLTIALPGYRSRTIAAHDRVIVKLTALGEHEGSTVSITALQSPAAARKAFDRGRVSAARRDWSAAEREFQKALRIDAENANVWDELGSAQEALSRPAEARQSFERAAQLDSRFIKPRVHLARLALSESRPADALAAASAAIRLTPVEFPQAFLYHAMAAATLERYDIAEASAAQAIEWDSQHEFPRAEYLLATLLQRKGDTAGAIAHFNRYVELAPLAPDSAAVRNRVALLATRAAR